MNAELERVIAEAEAAEAARMAAQAELDAAEESTLEAERIEADMLAASVAGEVDGKDLARAQGTLGKARDTLRGWGNRAGLLAAKAQDAAAKRADAQALEEARLRREFEAYAAQRIAELAIELPERHREAMQLWAEFLALWQRTHNAEQGRYNASLNASRAALRASLMDRDFEAVEASNPLPSHVHGLSGKAGRGTISAAEYAARIEAQWREGRE